MRWTLGLRRQPSRVRTAVKARVRRIGSEFPVGVQLRAIDEAVEILTDYARQLRDELDG
jgi:hypothetical protein